MGLLLYSTGLLQRNRYQHATARLNLSLCFCKRRADTGAVFFKTETLPLVPKLSVVLALVLWGLAWGTTVTQRVGGTHRRHEKVLPSSMPLPWLWGKRKHPGNGSFLVFSVDVATERISGLEWLPRTFSWKGLEFQCCQWESGKTADVPSTGH